MIIGCCHPYKDLSQRRLQKNTKAIVTAIMNDKLTNFAKLVSSGSGGAYKSHIHPCDGFQLLICIGNLWQNVV